MDEGARDMAGGLRLYLFASLGLSSTRFCRWGFVRRIVGREEYKETMAKPTCLR